MEFVENSIGRRVPTEIDGRKLTPFNGAFAFKPKKRKAAFNLEFGRGEKLLPSIKDAIEAVGLENGMTISFHHHLREGDYILNMVLDIIAEMGLKDITLAPSSLFNCHSKKIIQYIKKGVITGIEGGSLRGKLGAYVTAENPLKGPVFVRSHGDRVRAIKTGEIDIDVAFIGAPTADEYGNCNGLSGKSACGPLTYSHADAHYADNVVVITDNLVPYPATPITISQEYVDYVVEIDDIGDPSKIVSESTVVTKDPVSLLIAKRAMDLIKSSGALKDGFTFQAGAGGISLAVTRYIHEYMKEHKIVGNFAMGGTTEYLVKMLEDKVMRNILTVQAFDLSCIQSLRKDYRHAEITTSHYANIFSKGCAVNKLDVVVLGATEVDTKFNVNVNTHSDGLLLHPTGGHQDTAAGADLTVITAPLKRGRIPVIVEDVTTVTTPGETVDAVVTERGIAINPKRRGLFKRAKRKNLPVKTIEALKNEAYAICGKPTPPNLTDNIIGLIEYRDGTIIDVVRQVKRRSSGVFEKSI